MATIAIDKPAATLCPAPALPDIDFLIEIFYTGQRRYRQ